MKKKCKKGISILLSVTMLSGVLLGTSGCNDDQDKSANPDSETEFTEAHADPVEFSADGIYTTVLTMENGDFDGVTAQDIKVMYGASQKNSIAGEFDSEAGETDGEADKESDSAAETATENETDAETQPEGAGNYAEVLDASVNSDGSLGLTFKDQDAAENKTPYYGVLIEKNSVNAIVEVNFKEYNLTCDKEYVLSTDKAVKLTFTLDDGEYAQDIAKDDISLAGSFENMNIESVSASGKNLTMQLAGDLSLHEGSGVYLDGVVTLSEDTVKDNLAPLSVSVPVNTQTAYFDADSMQVSDHKITVPLVLIGITDTSALTPNDIVFEEADGISVESVTVVDEDEVSVVLNADGVKDKNSAAALLENTKVKAGDYEFLAGFVPASFYPVFDYIDEKDGKLEITTELYADYGKFTDSLDASQVSFGGDFKEASVTSLTRTGDTTAELIFTTAADGQTAKTVNLDGEIILGAGMLINRWGDAKEDETAYLRNYSAENIGRLAVGSVVNMFNKAAQFGQKFSSIVGGAVSAYNAVSTILDLTGLVPSAESQILTLVQDIKNQLNEIEQMLQEQTQLLKDIITSNINSDLEKFDSSIYNMDQYCNSIDSYMEEAIENVKRPSGSSNADWEKYAKDLVNYCSENYLNFSAIMNDLRTGYTNAATLLAYTNNNNPLYQFDKLCTMQYNFDSSSVSVRLNYRARAKYTMERALSYLLIYYVYGSKKVDNSARNLYVDYYNKAMQQYNASKYAVNTSSATAYSYVINRDVRLDARCHIDYEWGDWDEIYCYSAMYDDSGHDFDFSKKQIDEFVSRMQGRTLREELELAGFNLSGFTKNYVGIMFTCDERNGKWYWGRLRYKVKYYSYMMLWDEKTAHEELVASEQDNKSVYYKLAGFWFV